MFRVQGAEVSRVWAFDSGFRVQDLAFSFASWWSGCRL